jgi:hypothetical protein
MNIEKEINSILEKFIIHLYDDFNFEEAKLKIASEKDYATEEELYAKYWFGNKYVRHKILLTYNDINNSTSNDGLILEKICKEEFGQHYMDAFTVAFEKVPFYYRKYHGGRNAQLLTNQFIRKSTIEKVIMTYLTYYYYENYEDFEIIINNLINPNILK